MSDYPATSADINNVPRALSSTKLQKLVVSTVKGEEDRYEPWRTVENSMDELLEILTRFVVPNGKVWDPTCGTGVTALAALRTNRTCVLSDKDAPLVAAMAIRLRWYFLGFGRLTQVVKFQMPPPHPWTLRGVTASTTGLHRTRPSPTRTLNPRRTSPLLRLTSKVNSHTHAH